MDRELLLKQLTALDFTALDLHLFLDIHPEDHMAIAEYNKTIREADTVRCKYENLYGPLCSFRSLSKERFTWVDDPWPWQCDFNFEL